MNNIKISQETKEKILSFGVKGESYDAIIDRMCYLATICKLRDFLMYSEDCISIKDALKDALKEANRRWPRKK